MRRNLFRKTVEVHPPARASVQDVMFFDVRDHSESADLTLAERRLTAWVFAPWLLMTGHIAVMLSLLVDQASHFSWKFTAGVMLPLVASIAIDGAAGLIAIYWRKLGMSPHTVVRIMCGYLAGTGFLWAIGSAAAGSAELASASFVTVAMASCFFIRSIVSVPSPPVAVVKASS